MGAASRSHVRAHALIVARCGAEWVVEPCGLVGLVKAFTPGVLPGRRRACPVTAVLGRAVRGDGAEGGSEREKSEFHF